MWAVLGYISGFDWGDYLNWSSIIRQGTFWSGFTGKTCRFFVSWSWDRDFSSESLWVYKYH